MLERFTAERVIIFYLDTLNCVGVFFSADFSFPSQKTFAGIFKVIHVPNKKKKVGRGAAETEKPSPSLFHCSVFRDGRDYERITLRNMDAPNQIKAETIKARVKALSSLICLLALALPALDSTLSTFVPDEWSLGPTQAH